MAPSESAEASQGTSPISEDTHFSVDTPAHREDGAFKARKTKADIERLQAKIGQDILTLAHEDYGHQPIGKPKQMGSTPVAPNRTTYLTRIRFRSMFQTRRTGKMSAKIILLLPHYSNRHLRLVNQAILDALPCHDYPIPSESECKPPEGCVIPQAKYETLPLPPDS